MTEAKGLSQGAMDKLDRAVRKKLANRVPRELWSKAEIQYDAFYITGGACPSTPTLSGMQVTETRKKT